MPPSHPASNTYPALLAWLLPRPVYISSYSQNKLQVNYNKAGMILVVLLLLVRPGKAQEKGHSWAMTTVDGGNEKTTTLEFYFHDVVSGKSPTAIKVAQPPANSTSYPTGFGTLLMADDKLTEGPEPTSKLVGRAQGLYGSACQDELGLIMVMSYSFLEGVYNGSSISIMGRNSAMNPIRELPVVGGTGLFRMAKGYAVARTHWFSLNGDAIVGYNVTVIH